MICLEDFAREISQKRQAGTNDLIFFFDQRDMREHVECFQLVRKMRMAITDIWLEAEVNERLWRGYINVVCGLFDGYYYESRLEDLVVDLMKSGYSELAGEVIEIMVMLEKIGLRG